MRGKKGPNMKLCEDELIRELAKFTWIESLVVEFSSSQVLGELVSTSDVGV
jgi:hypothetical protein